jgi:hypothetical protein
VICYLAPYFGCTTTLHPRKGVGDKEDPMPKKKTSCVAVLTADIVRSTGYARDERRRVDRVLAKAFRDIIRLYPGALHTKFAFRVTAGDEFQCVFSAVPQSFHILTYLRAVGATSGLSPTLTFRASIGIGDISVSGKASPYEEDGQAFVRSRRGLEQLEKEKRTRWTKIVTGDLEADSAIDVILLLLDHTQKDWTVPQWEAVRWILTGLTREQVAKKLNVAHQSVTKRLAAADWHAFKISSDYLTRRLTEACKP